MKQVTYDIYRKWNTDIHVLQFNPKGFVFEAVQPTNRTPLSKIFSGWFRKLLYTEVAGINGTFFPFTDKSNPVGLSYLYEGVLTSDSWDNDEFMELIYDGKLHVDDIIFADLLALYPHTKWALSYGNLLALNGKRNLRKADKFDHTKYPNPRTMVGQKLDGTIILAVTDGRTGEDTGLTAEQQSDFMIEELGADLAVNGDGGGSSTMEIEGEIVNQLNGGYERPLANALKLYCLGAYKLVKTDHRTVVTTPTGYYLIGKKGHAEDNYLWNEVACNCGEAPIPDCIGQRKRMQKLRLHFEKKYGFCYIQVDVWHRCKKCNDRLIKLYVDYALNNPGKPNIYNKADPNTRHIDADACDSHVMVKEHKEDKWRELPSEEVVEDAKTIDSGFNNMGKYDTFSHLGHSNIGFNQWDKRTS